MIWPFKKRPEKRAASFTDAILEAHYNAAATGASANARATAALETCAGLWSRALGGAEISTPWVTPDVLAITGRELVRRGEAVFLIEIMDGQPMLYAASSWDVRGRSMNEDEWVYQLYLSAPDDTRTRLVRGEQVVHVRYGADASSPWLGKSPVAVASATGRLMGNLEGRLAQETGGLSAYLLPVPHGLVQPPDHDPDVTDPDTATFDPLSGIKDTLRKARGNAALIETTADAWGKGGDEAPRQDWEPKRIGANPPEVLEALRRSTEASVFSACGVPPSLVAPSQATGVREGWRLFLSGTMAPVAALVAHEMRRKLDPAATIRLDRLHGLDVRSRVFSSLVRQGEGLSADAAAEISGIRR